MITWLISMLRVAELAPPGGATATAVGAVKDLADQSLPKKPMLAENGGSLGGRMVVVSVGGVLMLGPVAFLQELNNKSSIKTE